MAHAQKVSTCLWFNTEAETAAQFYVSLFENSRVTGLSRYGKGARMPEGTVLMVTFELAGTEFMAVNEDRYRQARSRLRRQAQHKDRL